MKKSESIVKIMTALLDFSGEVTSISKDAKNPFFKSNYVTLDKLIEITRPLLHKNGLILVQTPLASEDGRVGIETALFHKSGEYLISEPIYMETPKKNDPQSAGSVISYMRRYSYQAILNLNTGEDDDGNKASRRGQPVEMTPDEKKELDKVKENNKSSAEFLDETPPTNTSRRNRKSKVD